jgi:hypothetical protein
MWHQQTLPESSSQPGYLVALDLIGNSHILVQENVFDTLFRMTTVEKTTKNKIAER